MNEARVAGPVVGPMIAAAAVLLVALMAIDSLPVGVAHDDGMYTVLAKSLATGQGYRWLNVPGAPAATHYPPGYPAVLSLLWRVFPAFPANVIAFKALNAVLLAAAAGFTVLLSERHLGLSSRVSVVTAVIGGVAVPTLVLSTLVMSEMLFLALLVPALLFAERAIARWGDDDRRALVDSALLGVAAAALMYVRSHGIAFAAAVAILLVLRRRWPALGVFAAIAIALMLPWQLWQAAHRGGVPEAMRGDYESYGAWLLGGAQHDGLGLLLRTIAATSRELFATFVAVSSAGLPTVALRLLATLIALAFVALGWWRAFKRAPVTAMFVFVYVGIVVLWPFTPARFIWGIWPLLVLLFVAGVVRVHELTRARPPAFPAAAWVAAAVVVVGYTTYNVRGFRGQWWSSIGRQTAGVAWPTVQWTAQHTAATDVVSTNAELMVYLYTGRRAIPATRFSVDDFFALPSAESRAHALRSILDSYAVNVVAVIANDSLEAAARTMAATAPPTLALRDSVPHGLIFSSMVR